jgi:hypothetical protein
MVWFMESAAEILATSPALKKRAKDVVSLTRYQEKFVDAAEVIRLDPDGAEVSFMARELVQCTLPHKDPGNIPIWRRQNGSVTLAIQQRYDARTGEPIGYPYGSLPRLLLFWITAEAVKTKSRRLELGHSLSAFMRQLGLIPASAGGGKRSDARRLEKQAKRLFRSIISFDNQGGDRRAQWLDMEVAPVGELWWDWKPNDNPEQGTLWPGWIELGEKFYAAVTAWPVPLDMRVLRAIKRSPLALDVYAWATWRVFKLSKSTFIPWEGLKEQMGSEYKTVDEFARNVKMALRKIRVVYPGLKLDYAKGGFTLRPSLTAIAPAPKRVVIAGGKSPGDGSDKQENVY